MDPQFVQTAILVLEPFGLQSVVYLLIPQDDPIFGLLS